ncbi:hypothetical protein M408DRAFT_330837 [Serendipita vermifera MAFF 305830]|uniref:Uncharacterized protein n=1 Tax=Serendipita vermifera MAFF 305830 TaxID=933852 RepID=A0A0C3B1K2_SERVB|nr:hypothetical protein M408DRAFT_330837 [Serendipita vermifera MAFF 305830]
MSKLSDDDEEEAVDGQNGKNVAWANPSKHGRTEMSSRPYRTGSSQYMEDSRPMPTNETLVPGKSH